MKPEAAKRLKGTLKAIFRRGRGRNISRMIKEELQPVVRGWTAYFRLAEAKNTFFGWTSGCAIDSEPFCGDSGKPLKNAEENGWRWGQRTAGQ